MSKKRDNDQKSANVQRTGGADHHVSRSTVENQGIKSENDYQKGDVNSVSEDMKISRSEAIEKNQER